MSNHGNPNRLRLRRRAARALAFGTACIGVAILFVDLPKLHAAERHCTIHERLGPKDSPPPAFSARDIRGVVTSPRLSTFDAENPRSFAFTVSGRVNANPKLWQIEVDALRSADLNPNEEKTGTEDNWQNVETIDITGGGPRVFTFEAGIKPFKDLPAAWEPGGLGRLRVVATMKDDPSECAFLPVLDSDGLDPANAATIVVADSMPDPTKPEEDDQTIKNPFNESTPNYLSANPRMPSWFFPTTPEAEPARLLLQELTTTSYYRTIGTNPDGTGRPIRLVIPSLTKFKEHYFEDVRTGVQKPFFPSGCISEDKEDEQVATYFNKGDLGIGRDMHCIYGAWPAT
jgi:hypothetical protein